MPATCPMERPDTGTHETDAMTVTCTSAGFGDRVEVRVRETALCDPVDVRGLDRAAERLHRREPGIVEHRLQHARRALRRLLLPVRFPIRNSILDVDVGPALERRRHRSTSPLARHPTLTPGGRRRVTPGMIVRRSLPKGGVPPTSRLGAASPDESSPRGDGLSRRSPKTCVVALRGCRGQKGDKP